MLVFRLRRTLRLVFLALALLGVSTAATARWPHHLQPLPRFVVGAGRRVVGMRMGQAQLWLPRAAVEPLHGLVLLLFGVWAGAEAISRRGVSRAVVVRAPEREYFSPDYDAMALRVAVGPTPPTPVAPQAEPAGAAPAPALAPATPAPAVPARVAAPPEPAATRLDEAEEMEKAVARLDADDPISAIRILEELRRRAYKMDLVSYYLAIAYAANRQPEELKAIFQGMNPSALPVQRRYKLACMLEEARLYEQALPLYRDLEPERRRYPDIAERMARVRSIIFDGGPEAFDRQLVGLLNPRYSQAKVLASGGMGIVFTAWDGELGRRVAIKMLSPLLRNDEHSHKRFLREGNLLLEMEHPNLVRTFNVYAEPCPHYSMEFLEGRTLAQVISADAPLPLGKMKHLAQQMLLALDYCHQRKIVHRDIKPANVLVPEHAPLKIIDFGLVRLGMSTTITVEGTVMGTPPYMPREQLAGEEVDQTADLYSFGVVLYEMATGKLPFPPGDTMTQAIAMGRFAPASSLRADLPPGFDTVIGRLLHRDRAERPTLAGKVAEALAQVLPG